MNKDFGKYRPIVTWYVRWACKKYPSFTRDEAYSAAHEGLWKALKNKKRDVGFIRYAQIKVLGSLQDYIRKHIFNERSPKVIQESDYIDDLFYFDDEGMFNANKADKYPPEALITRADREHGQLEAWLIVRPLLNGNSPLNDKEKKLIKPRYYKDMNLIDIGLLMGFSESRACQVHDMAIKKLRKVL